MIDIITQIANNGIGIVCVGYLIYFQSTTMKEIQKVLQLINERLIKIEDRVGVNNEK